jgi:hypothetical protein
MQVAQNHIMRICNLLFILLPLICKGQSPVLPLISTNPEITQGAYYKDLNNELDKFTGTWKFNDINTNISFTIVLKKKAMFYNSYDNYYEDILVGEYKYTQNNIPIINTLSNLEIDYTSQFKYNISGLIVMDVHNELIASRRIRLDFTDPDRAYLNRAIVVNYNFVPHAQPTITVNWTGDISFIIDENSPTEIRVPQVEYILTKQP